MSGRLVGEVFTNAPQDLTAGELLVLLAIAEDARDRDRTATFSDVETITYKTRLKPGTVRNALVALTARGLIRPLLQTVHRGGKHQEYVVEKLHPHHREATR